MFSERFCLFLLTFYLFLRPSKFLIQFIRKIEASFWFWYLLFFLGFFLSLLLSLFLLLALSTFILFSTCFLIFFNLKALRSSVHYQRGARFKSFNILLFVKGNCSSEFFIDNLIVACLIFSFLDILFDPLTKLKMLGIRTTVKSKLK